MQICSAQNEVSMQCDLKIYAAAPGVLSFLRCTKPKPAGTVRVRATVENIRSIV